MGHLGSSQGPILTAPGTAQDLPQGCAGWVRQKAASTSRHQCTHTHTVLCHQGCFFTGVLKKLRNARLHPTLSISVAVLQSTIFSPRGPPAGHHLLPPHQQRAGAGGTVGKGPARTPGPQQGATSTQVAAGGSLRRLRPAKGAQKAMEARPQQGCQERRPQRARDEDGERDLLGSESVRSSLRPGKSG